MSETTPHTNDTCELLLDYVYGELDEARKRSFEEHLPGCARCQQEVASFGRVRTAAKRMMPSVEPSAPLTGALHAQLMHAAAQRKPRRGVLLAFPRRIVEHPALSAAAMFVLVGGAIAINWSRGKLAMPAAEQTVDAPKPTEVATATPKTPAAPAAEPMAAAKQKEQNDDVVAALGNKNEEGAGYYKGGKAGAKDGDGLGGIGTGSDKAAASAGDQTRIALDTPSGQLTVQRPAAHRASPAPKKEAPARMKNIATDGKLAKYDSRLADDEMAAPSKDEIGRGGLTNGVVGGAATAPQGATGTSSGGGRGGPLAENAKSSAPQDLERKKVAEKAPSSTRDVQQQSQHAYGAPAASTPSTINAPPPPAPTVATESAPAEREGTYRSQLQQPVQKPSANARNYDALRKNAVEWAKTGRCDEAIKGYEELQRANQYITPTDRVHWVHCLTQSGRQEEAQKRLDELKSEKRVTNAQIQDAEKELNDARRRVEPKAKAAKKSPAPADRAAESQTQSTSQQRRPAEAPPAQASPPDSTNTKVTKPAY